jgi:hypothetical protein
MLYTEYLTPLTKNEARVAQEDAVAMFLRSGGTVEVLRDRKNPKPMTARGKSNSGMKIRIDPTARFPTRT